MYQLLHVAPPFTETIAPWSAARRITSGFSGWNQIVWKSSPPGAPRTSSNVFPPSFERYVDVFAIQTVSRDRGWTLISAKSEPRPQRRFSPLTFTNVSPASSETKIPTRFSASSLRASTVA